MIELPQITLISRGHVAATCKRTFSCCKVTNKLAKTTNERI